MAPEVPQPPRPAEGSDLRQQALRLLCCTEPDAKAHGTRQLDVCGHLDTEAVLADPGTIPGRPALPALLPHTQLKQRSVHTPDGRAALIHALVHIELNAIDLALDLCWRFAGLPEPFYRQWLAVAREEALHFELLRDHLRSLGHAYGDFAAHAGLWQMAERTKHDLLARIALVPRTLEARGLEASPAVKAKLLAAGDRRGADILELILHDEIGHVALGNRWFRWLCERQGLAPVPTYAALAQQHEAPRLRGPFNLEARRAAGFDEAELQALADA